MPSDRQERALWLPHVYNLHVVDGHPHVHEAAKNILPNLICTYCRIRYFVIGPCNAKKTGWVPNVDLDFCQTLAITAAQVLQMYVQRWHFVHSGLDFKFETRQFLTHCPCRLQIGVQLHTNYKLDLISR